MKTVKRILAVLLTVCMVMGLAVTAVAAPAAPPTPSADGKGTLTITQAMAGTNYKVYKMLDVKDFEYKEDNVTLKSSVYYLKPDSAWVSFFVDATKLTATGDVTKSDIAQYVEVTKSADDDNYYVEWKAMSATDSTQPDEKMAIAFADAALAHAKTITNPTASKDAPKTKEDGAESIEVKFENLDYGYYLVDTNGGSVVVLDTFSPEKTIEEKNTAPVIDKRVKSVKGEDYTDKETGVTADGDWHKSNTANIGDTVEFKTTITIGAGAVNYILHDDMSNGLTFSAENAANIKVVLYNNTATDPTQDPTYDEAHKLELVKKDGTNNNHYEVKTSGTCNNTITGQTSACDFEIVFDASIFNKDGFEYNGTDYSIKEKDKIVVTYSATLNKDAVIAEAGNPNNTVLQYGDNTTALFKTAEDHTTTYTYKFDLVKTDKKDVVLTGATFALYESVDAANADTTETADSAIKLVMESEGVYRVALTGEANTVTVIPAGKPTIKGLGKGTYALKEIAAPDGYKKLTAPVEVEIVDANLDATITQKTEGDKTVDTYTNGGIRVINVKKSIFPHTGGIGVTVYYLAGGAIIALVAAAAVMVFKKRQNAKAE